MRQKRKRIKPISIHNHLIQTGAVRTGCPCSVIGRQPPVSAPRRVIPGDGRPVYLHDCGHPRRRGQNLPLRHGHTAHHRGCRRYIWSLAHTIHPLQIFQQGIGIGFRPRVSSTHIAVPKRWFSPNAAKSALNSRRLLEVTIPG